MSKMIKMITNSWLKNQKSQDILLLKNRNVSSNLSRRSQIFCKKLTLTATRRKSKTLTLCKTKRRSIMPMKKPPHNKTKSTSNLILMTIKATQKRTNSNHQRQTPKTRILCITTGLRRKIRRISKMQEDLMMEVMMILKKLIEKLQSKWEAQNHNQKWHKCSTKIIKTLITLSHPIHCLNL